MSNALQAREPSMDEILASIRRIIEGGDERGMGRLDPVALVAEPTGSGARDSDEDLLDRDARAFPEGAAGNLSDASLLPEGPGEPANDRTAVVAQLRRAVTDGAREGASEPLQGVKTASDDRDHAPGASTGTMQSEFATAPDLLEPNAVVRAPEISELASSEFRDRDAGLAREIPSQDDDDGAAPVSPAIQAARQSAQSLAARTERLIAVVAGMPEDDAEPAGVDGADHIEAGESAVYLSPALDDSIAATAIASQVDDPVAETEESLKDSLRSLRVDAFGEVALCAAADPMAIDAFAEFDEDEFANALLDRAGTHEPLASAATSDVADRPNVPSVEWNGAHEGSGISSSRGTVGGRSLHAEAPQNSRMEAAIHQLISEEAGHRVSSAFSDLAIAIRDEQMLTIDETIRTMLRPMLQEWLDDNLPYMVERLVREEIERVARGGRR